jgi:hypothetical protein
MRNFHRRFASLLLAGATLAAPVVITGCAARVDYTYHDPYYNDDHIWNHDEVVYYSQWERDTHRNHEDFRKRPAAEQKEYMDYRHSHPDNDHH